MKNKEKFQDKIFEIACEGGILAVEKRTNMICKCRDLYCDKCLFSNREGGCSKARKEWGEAEYVEPKVDWSKVPVDTPILVRDSEVESWARRYFAKYEDGKVHTWRYGATSWSNHDISLSQWNYAKLAETEKEN